MAPDPTEPKKTDAEALEAYRKRIRATMHEGERKVDQLPGSPVQKLLAKQAIRREARRYVGRAGLR